MVRLATKEDKHGVIEVGLNFMQETVFNNYDFEKLCNLYDYCLDKGVIVVAEEDGVIVGALAAFYEDYQFGNDKFAHELFWYVVPEFRGVGKKIFDLFEKKCIEDGCKAICMVAYKNETQALVDRLYKRSGYTEIETHYYKEL